MTSASVLPEAGSGKVTDEKLAIEPENLAIETENVAIGGERLAIEVTIERLNSNENIANGTVTAAGNLISKLKEAGVIEAVIGYGKGKYKFKDPDR